MNLLAPKSEKQNNESDNETAPLAYTYLVVHDNTDTSTISPNAESTQSITVKDKDSAVQLYEDDIVAMYAKPTKKNKK